MSAFNYYETAEQEHQQVSQEDPYDGVDVIEYSTEEKKQFSEIVKRSRQSRREWLEEKEPREWLTKSQLLWR